MQRQAAAGEPSGEDSLDSRKRRGSGSGSSTSSDGEDEGVEMGLGGWGGAARKAQQRRKQAAASGVGGDGGGGGGGPASIFESTSGAAVAAVALAEGGGGSGGGVQGGLGSVAQREGLTVRGGGGWGWRRGGVLVQGRAGLWGTVRGCGGGFGIRAVPCRHAAAACGSLLSRASCHVRRMAERQDVRSGCVRVPSTPLKQSCCINV